MAYSRFLTSGWYIYWYAGGRGHKTKAGELLCLDSEKMRMITYAEAKKARKHGEYETLLQMDPIPEKEHVVSCIKRWMKNVEDHYEEKHRTN